MIPVNAGISSHVKEPDLNLRNLKTLKEARVDFDKSYIDKVLEFTSGNKGKAAVLLGLSREGLRKVLNRTNSKSLQKKVA